MIGISLGWDWELRLFGVFRRPRSLPLVHCQSQHQPVFFFVAVGFLHRLAFPVSACGWLICSRIIDRAAELRACMVQEFITQFLQVSCSFITPYRQRSSQAGRTGFSPSLPGRDPVNFRPVLMLVAVDRASQSCVPGPECCSSKFDPFAGVRQSETTHH